MNLKTKDKLKNVFPEEISEIQENSIVVNGFTAESGSQFCYHLHPLILQLSLSYFIDFSKDLYLDGNKDMILVVNNNSVSQQWSGLRFSIQAFFPFQKKSSCNCSENEFGLTF